jgi:Zn-finger nucleic acid-binding protein
MEKDIPYEIALCPLCNHKLLFAYDEETVIEAYADQSLVYMDGVSKKELARIRNESELEGDYCPACEIIFC